MTLPQTTNLAKNPFFSVIICLYDRKKIVCRAIESLLGQTEEDFELIIADDGSRDEPLEELCKYIDNERVRYFRQENRGVGAARNLGIGHARGQWITFLDSDDEYEPNHLESRRRIIESTRADFVYGGFRVVGDEFVPDRNSPSRLIHLSECVVGGTFFISKRVAAACRFPEIRFADDTEFFDEVRRSGFAMLRTDIPTYVYHRDSPDSICAKMITRCGD